MKYITIEREYGSGATLIARELSRKSGVPCYGEEILERASGNINMSPEQIRACEEKTTGSFLYSLYVLSQAHSGNTEMLSDESRVFVEEQRAVRDFAKEGSAIFIGHCAAEALKEEAGVWKVFIFADAKTKHRRIREDYGIAEGSVDSMEKRMNKRRSSYYYANTQKKWTDYRNYDIVLNSSELGIKGCADVLSGLLNVGT